MALVRECHLPAPRLSARNGMTVFSRPPGAGTYNSSHGPDTIALTIDTTGLALPAATYTGVLNVQAQAL